MSQPRFEPSTFKKALGHNNTISADERGGSRYKLPGPGGPKVGPVPDYVAKVFVFLGSIITCPLYKLTPSDQAQVNPSASDNQSLRFIVKICSRSALAAGKGGGEKIFQRGPNTLSAALHTTDL